MRFPSLLLTAAGLSLALAACESSSSRPPPRWGAHGHHGPHGQGPHGQGPHGPAYAMPWMIAVPPPAAAPGLVPAAAPPPSSTAEQDRCLSEAGTAADCEEALRKIAAAAPVASPAAGAGRVHDVYRRACEKKAKLLSCAVFRSTAVTDADKPQVELLMLCEGGRSEACEDVSTRSAPLQAWLSTLKAEHCKKGHQALCKNYRECKGPTQWGCRPDAAGAGAPQGEVCGCVPRLCGGPLTATARGRTWPDGTRRGQFSCAP